MSDRFDEWAEQVCGDLVPKLQASAATVQLVPDGPADVKMAVELGLSIMLDKPIILAVLPGRHVPDRLARVADAIVEWDDADHLGTVARIRAAVDAVVAP